MATPEEKNKNLDDEIAQVADAYFQDRKNGRAASIAAYLEKYPHLGADLRESLEAIDLLLAAPTERLQQDMPQNFSDYQIHQQLAHGGMGTVYLATQLSLQRKVALKVLKSLSPDQAMAAERLQREARTIAALQHDHIVPIYGAGAVDGCQYFAMRWIEGDSVAQLIAQQKKMTLSRADRRVRVMQIARWGAQIAEALAYAHQQGVVHCDIKPSNLLLDLDKRIWLSDFGLAYQDSDGSARMAGPYQGTPNYMSPEQASAIAAPVDHRTDIYSLGVTLIEWLTGQSVVGGSSPVESLSRLQHNSIEEPRRLLRGYSRDLVAVLEKCIARQPEDRYQSAADLAADLHAIADHRSVSVRPQPALIRHFRELISHRTSRQVAGLAACATIALLLLVGATWRWLSQANVQRLQFVSSSGEWLKVIARDESGRQRGECTTEDGVVLLPRDVVSADVSAFQRLGYQKSISRLLVDGGFKNIRLDAPQSHRWLCEDIVWYECRDLIRHGKSARHCIALRTGGVVLLDTSTGQILWSFHDEDTAWGNSIRGCLSTFQPDRCVVVQDTNGNDCQEIVLAHPNKPELLCLDSASGEQLWRTDLMASAGMRLPTAGSLCPIVLQYADDIVDQAARLSVVIAPFDRTLSTSHRSLMNVDPATGKVRWTVASLQSRGNPATAVPASIRPLHVQWGEVDQRPADFGVHTQFADVDGYGKAVPNRGLLNPFDNEPKLGTERPLLLRTASATAWHWIDGSDWHVIDIQSGQLIKTSKLPDDCVCSPKLLRSTECRSLLLTAHVAGGGTDFIAWDIETQQVVWKQTLDCDLNRLLQCYVSRPSDFPIVVDLDGDGSDEWIAPSHVSGSIWGYSMLPPYGMIRAHRGADGQAMWPEVCYLPNMDGMIERGVAIADQDGDGWKELLLGSRFQGVGVRNGIGCFVDVVSGKTGQRIWHSQVRSETSQPAMQRIELVDLTVLEDRRLIAVVTHNGKSNIETARPYSTTFLNLENGSEEAFGLGIKASHLDHDTWLEHRLAPLDPRGRVTRTPNQLAGWTYPVLKSDASESMTLWRTADYAPCEVVDLNRDGFPEVVGRRSEIGYDEFTLLDGVTGKKGWRRQMAASTTSYWYALHRDANDDAIDDLAVLLFDSNNQRETARLEIISGSTGKTVWKHTVAEPGSVNMVGYFERTADQLPLMVYQNEQTATVTCLDLASRKVAWSSQSFPSALETQAFKTWYSDGKIVWFSTGEAESGRIANFIDAESGRTLLQFAVGQRLYAPWTDWIRWEGQELLPILTITKLESSADQSGNLYRTDLWLVDRSLKIVGSWSETTDSVASKAAESWFERSHYERQLPKVIKTSAGRECLAIITGVDRGMGVRLLGWDADKSKQLVVDRSVSLPIDPNSTTASVSIADCNGDAIADFVSMTDEGIDCLSGTGESLWHRPPVPTGGNLGAFEHEGRQYLSFQTQPYDHNSMHFLDARTGLAIDGIQDDPKRNALNSENENDASFISCTYEPRRSVLTAIRKQGSRVPRMNKSEDDPRGVRLLPWVAEAKSTLHYNPVSVSLLSWPRIIKLVICVYLLPLVVGWSCLRRRISLRHLLLAATTVAVALSVVLADKNVHPMATSPSGYLTALNVAFQITIAVLILALPVFEILRGSWRRRLALGVYAAMLVIMPTLTLLTNPVGPIRTPYTLNGFWHLFWYALVPTGMLLFVIHALRLFGMGAMRMTKGLRRFIKSRGVASVPSLPGTGGSHGG